MAEQMAEQICRVEKSTTSVEMTGTVDSAQCAGRTVVVFVYRYRSARSGKKARRQAAAKSTTSARSRSTLAASLCEASSNSSTPDKAAHLGEREGDSREESTGSSSSSSRPRALGPGPWTQGPGSIAWTTADGRCAVSLPTSQQCCGSWSWKI